MFLFEGVTIRNFRSLNSVSLGKKWGTNGKPLPELVCIIGQPNTGKSNFFDVFKFIRDMNLYGIKTACDKRGGFDNIRTANKFSPIEFEFVLSDICGTEYRYLLSLNKDEHGNVTRKDNVTAKIPNKSLDVDFTTKVTSYFNDVFIPCFTEKGLRETYDNNISQILKEDGSNFVSVLNLKSGFDKEAKYFARHITEPLRIKSYSTAVKVERDDDCEFTYKQILMVDEGNSVVKKYEDNRKQISSNILKYMAYVVFCGTLYDYKVVCIQDLENGLYFTLQEELTELLRCAAGEHRKTVFMITHSPHVLNMLDDKNVFIFHTNANGHTEVKQACDLPLIHNMVEEGCQLGYLWTTDYLTPDKDGTFPGNPPDA